MPDSPTVEELRRKEHESIKVEVDKRLLQNADNFDKAILTYSATGLALSLGFLKDFVPILEAKYSWLLYGSWMLLVISVVITLGSYLTSQLAQHRQLEKSRLYNLEMNDAAFDLPNWPARITELASYGAGLTFVLGLSASTLFVMLNLEKGAEVSQRKNTLDGATVPTMQKITQSTEQRGAPTPTLQKVPQPAPSPSPAPSPTPASQSNSGSK